MANIKEILIPDIGSAKNVSIIEIPIKVGDVVKPEETLLTLEGEKATMEIPSPYAGKISEILVKVGDKVSMGTPIVKIEVGGEVAKPATAEKPSTPPPAPTQKTEITPQPPAAPASGQLHAGPAVRSLARELNIDLSRIKGTGNKGRITKEDLTAFIKLAMHQGGGGGGLPAAPEVDFSQFGPIKVEPLSRINKLSSTNLHRNWLLVPHITQFY